MKTVGFEPTGSGDRALRFQDRCGRTRNLRPRAEFTRLDCGAGKGSGKGVAVPFASSRELWPLSSSPSPSMRRSARSASAAPRRTWPTPSEQPTISGVGTPAKRTGSQPPAASRSRTTGRLTTTRPPPWWSPCGAPSSLRVGMRSHYDPKGDILYIGFADAKTVRSDKHDWGLVDIGADDQPIGIEYWVHPTPSLRSCSTRSPSPRGNGRDRHTQTSGRPRLASPESRSSYGTRRSSRPCTRSVSDSAMSIPAETPGPPTWLPCQTTRSPTDLDAHGAEVVAEAPVPGGGLALEQARGRVEPRAGETELSTRPRARLA